MPLNYMDRIKEYYQILGYGKAYEWAHFETVPFLPFTKSLENSTIGIITTAAPYQEGKGDQGPDSKYNGAVKFFKVYTGLTDEEPDLRISHIAYDRAHSKAEDQGSYFPLKAFKHLQKHGVIGKVSPRFYGLPTNRSQSTTINVDCVDLVSRCLEDNIDAVVLVPNCPVCHQSVSLAARALEAAGIATVIMGCAKDIIEHVGVPRLLFNNFPLGSAAGLPHDFSSQIEIAQQALALLSTAKNARTTVQSTFGWNGDINWQNDYSNGQLLSEEEIEQKRAEFDKGKEEAKKLKAKDI